MSKLELVGVVAKKTGTMYADENNPNPEVFCIVGHRYDARVVRDRYGKRTLVSTLVYKNHLWSDDFSRCKHFKPIYRVVG